MRTFCELIACEHCDALYRRRPLTRGGVARCPICSAVLYRADPQDFDRWLALTVTAAIVYAIANLSPVILIDFRGLHNQATLWQSALALAHGPIGPIALLAAATVIIVPFLQIVLLLWVLLPACRGRRGPGFPWAMRTLAALKPWSMVEVAVLGVLVAIVKLSSFLEVAPGLGAWATGALMLLITLIANHDTQCLWAMSEDGTCMPEPQP